MMSFKGLPIRRKLIVVILLTTAISLLPTCLVYFAHEFLTVRQAAARQFSIIGEVIAANSTAALAFANQGDAEEILSALKADRHITAAALYDNNGKLFSKYPLNLPDQALPVIPLRDGFQFEGATLVGFKPVVQNGQSLGTLYLKYDMGTVLHEWLRASAGVALAVMAGALWLAYLLSRKLQQQISQPILALAWTAKDISDRRDYSVRAEKMSTDEIGLLTDAFNQMLAQIQKQTEALIESELRVRAVVNSALSAVVVIDATGSIVDWNLRAEQMFGRSRQEALGGNLAGLVLPGRYRDRVQRGIRHYLATGEGPALNQIIELHALHSDGREFPVELSVSPMKTGGMVTFCGFFTDITERKRAEEVRAHFHQELEQRVIERTAQLEAANKELEAFSYTISHDLRTPLRAVNGFAGIVLEDYGPQLPAEGRHYLVRIREGGRRMGELIDDLLAFSRLGRQNLSRQTVDAARLVQTVIDELGPQREGRRVEIKIGNLPACHGDPALLKQVWVNLISNAIKYTRGREPALIEIGCLGENGGQVYFVRDNGAGFDMQYADKLFGVFQRLHRTNEFEGTGVGLAIVQRIIQRHGGRVWAEAAVQRGATFYFTIAAEKGK